VLPDSLGDPGIVDHDAIGVEDDVLDEDAIVRIGRLEVHDVVAGVVFASVRVALDRAVERSVWPSDAAVPDPLR
jgi:hypothetical protein